MPKHIFPETTVLPNKTFFAGEADISEAEAKAIGLVSATEEAKSNEAVEAQSAFTEDFPGFDVLGQVEGLTQEKVFGMSDDDLLEIKGIGQKTLEQIRAYKGK